MNCGNRIRLASILLAGAFVGPLAAQQPSPSSVVEGRGVAVVAPSGWQLNRTVLELGGPIAFTTFGRSHLRGGIMPPGGAEIDVATAPVPAVPLPELVQKELEGATIQSRQETIVAGNVALRVVYTDSFGPTLRYDNIAVYIPRASNLYKFFLTYHSGDSSANRFIADFNRLVNTARFAQ